jgi:hypothetical protein
MSLGKWEYQPGILVPTYHAAVINLRRKCKYWNETGYLIIARKSGEPALENSQVRQQESMPRVMPQEPVTRRLPKALPPSWRLTLQLSPVSLHHPLGLQSPRWEHWQA